MELNGRKKLEWTLLLNQKSEVSDFVSVWFVQLLSDFECVSLLSITYTSTGNPVPYLRSGYVVRERVLWGQGCVLFTRLS